MMTDAGGIWIEAGRFDTMIAAAARVREIEGYPVSGLFLEMHVDTVHGTDEGSFGHLEHKGRLARYALKRVIPT